MNTNGVRAAIYLRVSRDDQTTEKQRLVMARVAEHRGWLIVQTYEDQGISGAKGREQRAAFDAMLKDAVLRPAVRNFPQSQSWPCRWADSKQSALASQPPDT
jgi:hypothetical protein